MYKLVVLTCFIAITVQGYHHNDHIKTVSVHSTIPVVKTALVQEPATIAVQEKTLAKVGQHIESIPTAVSHQSQTVLHSEPSHVTPILAPAVKTHYAPAVRTVEKQYIEKIPIVQQYVAPAVVKSYDSQIDAQSYDLSSLSGSYGSEIQSYAAPSIVKSYGTPYSSQYANSAAVVKSYNKPIVSQTYAPVIAQSYAQPALYKSYNVPDIQQSYGQQAVYKSYDAPVIAQSYVQPALYKSYNVPAIQQSYGQQVQSYGQSALYKSYNVPAIQQSYGQQAVYKSYDAPVIAQSYAQPALYKSYNVPAIQQSYGQQPIYNSYDAPTVIQSTPTIVKSYAAPANYIKSYSAPALIKTINAPLAAESAIYRSDLQQYGNKW